MVHAQIAAFGAAIIVVVTVYIAYRRRLACDRKRLLESRNPVPSREFGATHYPADPVRAEIASFILLKFEELTAYDFKGALPEDRIVDDLRVDELDSLATVEIIQDVEVRFGIKVTDTEAAATQTLNDFIELVAVKRGGG
ncbi:MAG TPA: acyl carrier protein [Thermoanaerobaculia bacterium]|jgi:acyl carrier protein|nr:acyl carrier protein [Thermoanaerobaculia bacterium]